MNNLKIQFVSDSLVQKIIEGRKTASVVGLDEVDLKEDEYNDPLVVGKGHYPHCSYGVMPLGFDPGKIVAGGDQFKCG